MSSYESELTIVSGKVEITDGEGNCYLITETRSLLTTMKVTGVDCDVPRRLSDTLSDPVYNYMKGILNGKSQQTLLDNLNNQLWVRAEIEGALLTDLSNKYHNDSLMDCDGTQQRLPPPNPSIVFRASERETLAFMRLSDREIDRLLPNLLASITYSSLLSMRG